MATTQVVEMDDRELFRGAMAEEAAPETSEAITPEVKAEPEGEAEGQPRDEQGRFAPKAEATAEKPPEKAAEPEATETTPAEGKDEQGGQVPSWRLREVREAREAAERRAIEADQQRYALQQEMQQMRMQLAQLQRPKSEPVDFFANPDEALQQRLTPLEEKFNQFEMRMRLNSSRAVAIATHGVEAVNEMDQAVAKAMRENHPELPYLRAQMQSSDDPVGVAMRWHRSTRLWETTGGDPDAYRQKILEEAAKDPKFQAKVLENARAAAGGTNGSRPVTQLPPSLSKAPGTGSTQAADLGDADMSDSSLFRYAMSSSHR